MKKIFAMSLAVAAMVTAANAVTLWAENFDGLSDGLIGGQAGWSNFSDPVFFVQSGVNNGGKAVHADLTSVTSGSRWGWPDFAPEHDTTTTTDDLVVTEVDVLYNGTDMRFGLDAYQTTPTFGRVHAIRVNTTTNRVSFLNTAGTAFVDSTMVTTANTWSRLGLILDYGRSRAWGTYNGQLIDLTETFPATFIKSSDVDLYAVKLTTGTGNGYFDNYKVDAVGSAFIAYTVTTGELFTGSVASLQASDDDKLSIFNDPFSLVATITASGVTTVLNPANVTVGLEASADRGGLSQSIALFNYNTNTFQVLDGSVATGSDSNRSVTANSNFVDARGLVQARISWAPINDEDPSQDGWLHNVDALTLSAN